METGEFEVVEDKDFVYNLYSYFSTESKIPGAFVARLSLICTENNIEIMIRKYSGRMFLETVNGFEQVDVQYNFIYDTKIDFVSTQTFAKDVALKKNTLKIKKKRDLQEANSMLILYLDSPEDNYYPIAIFVERKKILYYNKEVDVYRFKKQMEMISKTAPHSKSLDDIMNKFAKMEED